jgi:hypothetical protein
MIILLFSGCIPITLTVSARNPSSSTKEKILAPIKGMNSLITMPGRKLLLSKTISLLVMNAKITATVHAIILYTIII